MNGEIDLLHGLFDGRNSAADVLGDNHSDNRLRAGFLYGSLEKIHGVGRHWPRGGGHDTGGCQTLKEVSAGDIDAFTQTFPAPDDDLRDHVDVMLGHEFGGQISGGVSHKRESRCHRQLLSWYCSESGLQDGWRTKTGLRRIPPQQMVWPEYKVERDGLTTSFYA